MSFTPTSSSIPPPNTVLRPSVPINTPANHTPLNPLHFLLRAALIYPDKLALVHPDVPSPAFYTYAVWAQRVQNLAYALIDVGVTPGDRVAVIAPNCPLIADAHQGVLAACAVVTPINYRLTPSEVAYILEHSGAKVLLIDHQFVHLAENYVKSSQDTVNGIRVIVSHDTGREGCPYEKFLERGRSVSRERGWSGLRFETDEMAAATLCYTSGTTGKPKGVVSTLRGSYMGAVASAFEVQLDIKSVYLWVLPMFHAAGWTFPWACIFGFSTQITLRTVSYPHIWKHLKTSGVTHFCGAPTVQIGLVNAPDATPLPASQPVTTIVAGSAPTASMIASLEKLGINTVHVYGLTETSGPMTRMYPHPAWETMKLDERAKLMGRQGFAFATADEIRVIEQRDDDQILDVPRDGSTLGEIVIRGNKVMSGYYKDASATASVLRGGYFHSGDLAVRHADGSIAIQDRSKDLINSGGEKASSLSIEQELSAHPDVLEVSVVARSHPTWGERPMAFVVLQPNSQSAITHLQERGAFEKELKAYAKSRLPGFARPEWVEVVPELPKSSTGKILKVELRKLAAKL